MRAVLWTSRLADIHQLRVNHLSFEGTDLLQRFRTGLGVDLDRTAGRQSAFEDDVFDFFGVDVILLEVSQYRCEHAGLVVVADD